MKAEHTALLLGQVFSPFGGFFWSYYMKCETVKVDRDGVCVVVNKEDAKNEKLWSEPKQKTEPKKSKKSKQANP